MASSKAAEAIAGGGEWDAPVESSFPDPWTPEQPGDFITGTYLGSDVVKSNLRMKSEDGKPTFVSYRIRADVDGVRTNGKVETSDEPKVRAFAGGMLQSMMNQIPSGARVRVVFEGKQKLGSGFTARVFKVIPAKGTKLLDPYAEDAFDPTTGEMRS